MVTKGHDFPNLALVGIVDADMALGRAELRAGEQCFQMLTQVAGRAGRRNQRGMVIVQTYQPENPLIQAIIHLDKEAFYALELKHRKQWGDPPFSRLIALQVQGKNERDVKAAAQKLATEFASVNQQEAGLLGPAAANMARVNNVYRWRLIVQSKDPAHALVQQWLQSTALPNSIDVFIDVDPQALL